MGIIAAATSALDVFRRRRRFESVCASCGLKLDFAAHADDVTTLHEVFVDRVYADWFPFRRRATILDVGAHKGFFSLFAARRTLPGSTIVAVEPDPQNFAQLEANLDANGCDGVRRLNVGVEAVSGTATLHQDRSESHSLFPEHHERLRHRRVDDAWDAPSTTIKVLSLADLLDRAELPHVDFLKLDCEGAEYATLMEADAATLARIDVISAEFHDLGESGLTGRDLAEFLQTRGFTIARLTHGPTTIDNDYGRLIAVRST